MVSELSSEELDYPKDLEFSVNAQVLMRSFHDHFRSKKYHNYTQNVPRSISFLAVAYEKMRNAMEIHEDHLIRRAAIKRILNRRLTLNPPGKGEGGNLLRELLWGRYLTSEDLSSSIEASIEKIIANYFYFKKQLSLYTPSHARPFLEDFLLDLLSTEIDESIFVTLSKLENNKVYFFYHTLREKVDFEGLTDLRKDNFFYIACEKSIGKNDLTTIRAHMFFLQNSPLGEYSHTGLDELAKDFFTQARQIDISINHDMTHLLFRFARKNVAPFRILYEFIGKNKANYQEILSRKSLLKSHLQDFCQEKYKESKLKLSLLARRSIIYIFSTKMLLVLLIEIPLSNLFYHETEYMAILTNTFFPPFLLFIITLFISAPSEKNTQSIIARVQEILDKERNFEIQKVAVKVKTDSVRWRANIFMLIYLVIFAFIFSFVYLTLDYLGFKLISKGIFIFFLCVVTFFAFRIKQSAQEYALLRDDNLIGHISDLVFLPILAIGKILSSQLSRFNILILFFDLLIEAPFKFVVEIFEDWQKFVKERHDEII